MNRAGSTGQPQACLADMSKELEEKFTAELERFKEAEKNMRAEITPLVKEASKLLREAVAVSEKYGLPYRFPLSFLRQIYTPNSFTKEWRGLRDQCSDMLDSASDDQVFDDAVVDLVDGYRPGEYAEWQHSAVC